MWAATFAGAAPAAADASARKSASALDLRKSPTLGGEIREGMEKGRGEREQKVRGEGGGVLVPVEVWEGVGLGSRSEE